MKESFVFYRSFYDAIKCLPDEQRLEIYEAIFEYGLNDNDVQLEGASQAIYNLTKPSINSANARYNASVENGRKGGRPKTNNLENLTKPNHNLDKPRYNLDKPNHNLTDTDTDTVNVTYTDNVNVNKNDADAVADNVQATAPAKDIVIDCYLNNINSLPTLHEVEQIREYQKEIPEDLFCYAIEIAVENKKRSLAYIKGILNSWRSKGITTLAEAKEEKKKFDSRRI